MTRFGQWRACNSRLTLARQPSICSSEMTRAPRRSNLGCSSLKRATAIFVWKASRGSGMSSRRKNCNGRHACLIRQGITRDTLTKRQLRINSLIINGRSECLGRSWNRIPRACFQVDKDNYGDCHQPVKRLGIVPRCYVAGRSVWINSSAATDSLHLAAFQYRALAVRGHQVANHRSIRDHT